MKRKQLLLLLALLMTAATGAWAQSAKHLITATYDKQTRSLEQPLPYATTVGELYEAVTGQSFSDLLTTMSLAETPLSGIGSTNTSVVSVGEFNYASTPVTVTADGKAAVALRFGSYTRGIFVSVTSPLYVTMKDGVKDADKWTVKVGEGEAQALPIGGLKGDGSETVTLQYNGRLKVKSVTATSDAAPAAPTGNTVDMSTLTANYEAQNGDVLTGKTTSYKVTIAAGATVTLDGVNISSGDYCIKCLGDATIILKDGSTNTLTGTGTKYPALSIGDANTTLTIQGSTGVLNVTSGEYCAGIGGGFENDDRTCGNIRIEGGVITAQGGNSGSGIGSDCGKARCGDIIITGGTVTATGGMNAAGIGTGEGDEYEASCGNITITNGVTKVTAKKGAYAPNSIGKGDGDNASCGTVTIGGTLDTNGNPVGGTKYWENNAAVNGGDTYLAQSPLIYDPTAAAAFAADEYNEASWDDTNKKVVFEKKKATTTPTAVANSNTAVTWSDGWYTVSGEVTIGGNVTLTADTYLILQDGATLTINGQLNARDNQKNLYIYGQKKGDGKLNVICGSDIAIYGESGKTVEIHGGEITAEGGGEGLLFGYIKVFSGKITAICGSGGFDVINFMNSCDVYGGEIDATTNFLDDASSGFYDNENGGTLTVYGGKVKATGNGVQMDPYYGSGFAAKVKSGTAGIKFYFSDNGTDWDEGTYYGTATAAPRKKYAKAE